MSIKESMLNIVSDLAQNDYIRAVTYGGYSRRVEVSELAKSVVEDYTGSSLAGENQSVQGAFSALETEIQNVEQDVTAEINDAILNILPTDTASGEIASFPDGSDLSPALSVVAGIEPVQDLHGYDAPWVGGAGKNKCPLPSSAQTLNGVTVEATADGEIWVHGTPISTSGYSSFTLGNVPQSIVGQTITLSINEKIDGIGFISGAQTGDLNLTMGDTVTTKTGTYIAGGSNIALLNVRADIGTIDKKFKIQLELGTTPTAWTPYENICPISGHTEVDVVRTGVNAWDEEWEQGGIYPSTGAPYNANNRIRSKNYIKCNPNTTYAAADPTHGDNIQLIYFDENKQFVGASAWMGDSATATTPSNCHYLKFYTGGSYGGTYNHDISINYPSTDHDYHAYVGQSYTETLPSTTYGGTLDVVSGLLTVDRVVEIFDGTESGWTTGTAGGGTTFISPILPNVGLNDTTHKQLYNMAEWVQYADRNGMLLNPSNNKIYVGSALTASAFNSDLATFKTYLRNNPLQVCYYLATPQTYQLTPTQIQTLLGQNNVWSDAGDMSVTYKADIQLYIDKQTNELRVAVLALS